MDSEREPQTKLDVIVSAKIPPEIAEALQAASAEMPDLRKGEQNKYANYAYASIDDFYREVVPVMLRHGLTWRTRQISYTVEPKHIVAEYEMDLIHRGGAMLPNYFNCTIVHPLAGAQTSGSALSYAEKIFMRSVFKVATGEPDADATDNTTQAAAQMPATRTAPKVTPPPVKLTPAEKKNASIVTKILETKDQVGALPERLPIPNDTAGWHLAAQTLVTFVPECSTLDDLTKYWVENTEVIDRLSVVDIDLYEKVKFAFTTRKNELNQQERQ
jgi:hypothetical protein